jgi:Protein of unknown function (DUF2971)
VVLAAMWENFTDIIIKNINRAPTCLDEEMRNKIRLLQAAFREHPDKIETLRAEAEKVPVSEIYNLELMKERSAAYIRELNAMLQDHRILCVSKKPDSMRMWDRYAQRHEGVVLRIEPNLSNDSKFARFRAVKYQEGRPSLYDDAISFLESGFFEDQIERTKRLVDKIVYTKTLEWEYEQEQRLAIPIPSGEQWDVMPCHPEEISEVILGAKMNDQIKEKVMTLAKALNPEIAIYQAVKGSTEISFFFLGSAAPAYDRQLDEQMVLGFGTLGEFPVRLSSTSGLSCPVHRSRRNLEYGTAAFDGYP